MYRVLLVGDEAELRSLAGPLEQHDLHTVIASASEAAIERALHPLPDVLVLDLEDVGHEQLRHLVSDAALAEHAAILFLASEALLRRLDGDFLPDDFVVKPVRQAELVARVRLALRRRTNVDAQNQLRCGDLVIDLANYKVTVSGNPVELTYKEYELLRFLMSNPSKVFTREQLLNRVWGYDYFGGARTVDVHIRRLRSKIELRPGEIFIDTVRNVGYRFKEC